MAASASSSIQATGEVTPGVSGPAGVEAAVSLVFPAPPGTTVTDLKSGEELVTDGFVGSMAQRYAASARLPAANCMGTRTGAWVWLFHSYRFLP
jgi:hypothetical protein